MKLYNVHDIKGLEKTIDQCQGKVIMISDDGSALNLKSKLSQFIALSQVMGADEETIPEMELLLENPKDTVKLINYMLSA